MKKLILTFLILAGTAVKADPPSIHGMLVFGSNKTYLSHLPMFHPPHDYQIILEAEMEFKNLQTQRAYQLYKQQGEIFTIAPEKFDLSEIYKGTRTSFNASLFRGHFERGGFELGEVKIKINKIVFSKKLNPNDLDKTEEFVKFGDNNETFAAHVIKGHPSYDQILKINPDGTQNEIYKEVDELSH